MGNRPLGSSIGGSSGSLGGSGMLQSVPAQVVSHVHVASLLHTCTDQTGIDEWNGRALSKDAAATGFLHPQDEVFWLKYTAVGEASEALNQTDMLQYHRKNTAALFY